MEAARRISKNKVDSPLILVNQMESYKSLEDNEVTLFSQKGTIKVPLIHKSRENNEVYLIALSMRLN